MSLITLIDIVKSAPRYGVRVWSQLRIKKKEEGAAHRLLPAASEDAIIRLNCQHLNKSAI